MTKKNITLLGFDPGLNFTGWGIISKITFNKFKYIASGVIKTANKMEHSKKINYIFNQSFKIIKNYRPDCVAIENIYVNKNYSSSIALAEARAALVISTAQNNLTFTEYAAKKIKKNISHTGNASKYQMQKMLSIWLPQTIIQLSDEADALAIAVLHANYYK